MTARTDPEAELTRALRDWLRPRLAADPGMARAARALGSLLVALADAAETPAADPAPTGSAPAPTEAAPVPAATPEVVVQPAARSTITGPRAILELRLADAPPQTIEVQTTDGELALAAQRARPQPRELAPPAPAAAALPDLDAIARRCEFKSRACALAIERSPDPAWRARADDLLRRAPSACPGGAWVLDDAPTRDNLAALRDSFATTAAAARIVHAARQTVEGARLVRPGEAMEIELLTALAEAQSSLRIAVDAAGAPEDPDQAEAYRWLYRVTKDEQVYLPRYMRLGDPGDPAAAAALLDRLSRFDRHVRDLREARTASGRLRNKARYHAKKILESAGAGEPGDWAAVGAAARALVDHGETVATVRALLRDLRESQAWDAAPDELRADLASPADARDDPDSRPRQYGPDVARVRAAVEGRRVVLLGGSNYPHQGENLVRAFGVDLDWVRINEHASAEPIATAAARPGTALVLVMVKLAGHHHIDVARDACDRAGVPCVMLKAGVNPERVAADILAQASRALGLESTGDE